MGNSSREIAKEEFHPRVIAGLTRDVYNKAVAVWRERGRGEGHVQEEGIYTGKRGGRSRVSLLILSAVVCAAWIRQMCPRKR